jgi:hypothetical protein
MASSSSQFTGGLVDDAFCRHFDLPTCFGEYLRGIGFRRTIDLKDIFNSDSLLEDAKERLLLGEFIRFVGAKSSCRELPPTRADSLLLGGSPGSSSTSSTSPTADNSISEQGFFTQTQPNENGRKLGSKNLTWSEPVVVARLADFNSATEAKKAAKKFKSFPNPLFNHVWIRSGMFQ